MFKHTLSILLALALILTGLPPPWAFSNDETQKSGMITGPSAGDLASGNEVLPSDKEGGKGDQTGDTDPVLLHQGDYRLDSLDLLIPSRGMPVEIKRTYRSRSRYNGPFGYGWDFNFNIRLRKRSNGDVVILTGDNRRNEFTFAGTSYQAPPGIYETLVQNPDGSFTLTTKHGEVKEFDTDGKLISMRDRNTNTMTFTYDPAGKLPVTGTSPYFVTQTTGIVVMDYRLIQITDTVGRNVDLIYDTNGRLVKIKDFMGRVLTYGYDANGDLISFGEIPPGGLLPGETLMGYKTTYTYTDHNLETITDAKGQLYLQNIYDPYDPATDRVIQQTYGDPFESGGTSIINYDPSGNKTTVTDRKIFNTEWTFNADGNPIRKEQFTQGIRPTDPVSYVTLYEYNSNLEQTKITFPKGNVTEFQYDALGNLLEIRRKGNPPNPDIVTTFTYEPQFNQIKTITDPRMNVTTYTYDYELGEPAKGNLRKITFPSVDGETIETIFTYNGFGQLETATDPNSNVTKYEYAPATGYLTKITNGFGTPEAAVTEMGYDPVGNVTSVKDPRLNTISFQYDVNNNLKQATAPAPFNFLTKYTYDPNGNLEKLERQSDPTGTTFQTTTYTYTALDQLKTITDNQGNITKFEYDPNGNRREIIDAENKATDYIYDERDLLFTVINANTTTYGYDGNGNLASIQDANGRVTQYQYDEFDRLKKTIYPDLSEENYTYDATSNLKTKTDPKSQLITYDYDELNRLTFKTYNGCLVSVCGGNVDYIYDPGSRLETVSNNLVTINYPVYDALNRIKQATTTLNGTNYTLNYQYDTAGNRTQLTYPHGTLIKFNSDELNRLDTIKDSIDTILYDFGYDELSRRTSLTRPSPVTTSYAYDPLNRLTQIQHGSISTIGYPLYDKVGNRKQMTNSQGTHTYDYDFIYQLTSVSGALVATFNYDPVGNRSFVAESGSPSDYIPNNLNQYTSVDGTPFTYDANGNLTNDGTYTYEYDFENRLIKATVIASASEAIYQYDPFGRRITKSGTLTPTPQSYLYDGDQIIETYPCDLTAGTCALSQSFLYGSGIDEPLELTDHPTLTKHYYHQDGIGSVTQITDSTGAVQESYFYSPYGIPEIRDATNTVIPGSSIGNPYLFTGREYDFETGLYYYRARHFNPRIGRFLQRDTYSPVAEAPETFHPYKYSFNNPIRFIDPDGKHPALVTVGGGIIIIGTVLGAVVGGYQAYQEGESISVGALRGALQGAGASATAVIATAKSFNPILGGAAAATTANLIGQGFDSYVKGKTFSRASLTSDTITGAVLGPLVKASIPLRGFAPNLFTPRTMTELGRANTQRLFSRTALGVAYKFFLIQVLRVERAEGAEVESKK